MAVFVHAVPYWHWQRVRHKPLYPLSITTTSKTYPNTPLAIVVRRVRFANGLAVFFEGSGERSRPNGKAGHIADIVIKGRNTTRNVGIVAVGPSRHEGTSAGATPG
jgi:hypothetical protein